ncbi:MAG: hypothetical protein JO076_03170 [Verrucomicrobia bacterium]|nr:hypothetical protein [Verrucomicrobiota bacterium]
MKVHLKQIPSEGLHIEGKETCDILELPASEGRPLNAVAYSLHIGKTESGLIVSGRLWVDLELVCVCCLTPFNYSIAVDDFAVQIDLSGNDEVDLTPFVREDILLALPAHPRCDWDRNTVCDGARLERADDNLPSSWDALNDLNLKN